MSFLNTSEYALIRELVSAVAQHARYLPHFLHSRLFDALVHAVHTQFLVAADGFDYRPRMPLRDAWIMALANDKVRRVLVSLKVRGASNKASIRAAIYAANQYLPLAWMQAFAYVSKTTRSTDGNSLTSIRRSESLAELADLFFKPKHPPGSTAPLGRHESNTTTHSSNLVRSCDDSELRNHQELDKGFEPGIGNMFQLTGVHDEEGPWLADRDAVKPAVTCNLVTESTIFSTSCSTSSLLPSPTLQHVNSANAGHLISLLSAPSSLDIVHIDTNTVHTPTNLSCDVHSTYPLDIRVSSDRSCSVATAGSPMSYDIELAQTRRSNEPSVTRSSRASAFRNHDSGAVLWRAVDGKLHFCENACLPDP